MERNKDIVDETAILIAAPASEEVVRSGTWYTVRYARKLGRPIYICCPDGRLIFENVPTQHEKWAASKRTPPVKQALQGSLASGTWCKICGSPQFNTTAGDTCENGHGGVDGITDPIKASGLRSWWIREGQAKEAGL